MDTTTQPAKIMARYIMTASTVIGSATAMAAPAGQELVCMDEAKHVAG
jgi:hypothetical protein